LTYLSSRPVRDLKEDKKMNGIEDFEEDAPDQSTTGWEPTPLSQDHWSLRPEWRKFKESLSETEATVTTEPTKDWYTYAVSLAGNEETL
jgi:hypothetical protein